MLGEVVMSTFVECIEFDSEHLSDEQVATVEGVRGQQRFSRERLAQNKATISAMIDRLPEAFSAESGASFMNGCVDRDGNQWTGLQPIVEQLFMLGMAIGRVEYVFPRESWPQLPGGMPFLRALPA